MRLPSFCSFLGFQGKRAIYDALRMYPEPVRLRGTHGPLFIMNPDTEMEPSRHAVPSLTGRIYMRTSPKSR